jgi:hypothetical protein
MLVEQEVRCNKLVVSLLVLRLVGRMKAKRTIEQVVHTIALVVHIIKLVVKQQLVIKRRVIKRRLIT